MLRTEMLITRQQAEARFIGAHKADFSLPTKHTDYVLVFPGGPVERLSWTDRRSDSGARLFNLVIED